MFAVPFDSDQRILNSTSPKTLGSQGKRGRRYFYTEWVGGEDAFGVGFLPDLLQLLVRCGIIIVLPNVLHVPVAIRTPEDAEVLLTEVINRLLVVLVLPFLGCLVVLVKDIPGPSNAGVSPAKSRAVICVLPEHGLRSAKDLQLGRDPQSVAVVGDDFVDPAREPLGPSNFGKCGRFGQIGALDVR